MLTLSLTIQQLFMKALLFVYEFAQVIEAVMLGTAKIMLNCLSCCI